MTFLPIVARELRVASRAGSTYWIRLVAVVVAIVVGGWTLLIWSRYQSANVVGRSIFQALSICAFAYCLLIGTRNTADCLSGEKREGTLGLLFLTDLRGYDIVLGKLAATSLASFYGLIAVVPVMAIPLLLGGVPAGEFWRVTLVQVNTMFFSLALGILVSAFSQHERKAIACVILLLLVFTGGLPTFGWWLAENVQRKPGAEPDFVFLAASPAFGISETANGTWKFWCSVALTHALAWLCLAIASLRLPHAWQDRPVGAKSTPWRERWRRLTHGDRESRARFRRRLLGLNPFYWLVARQRVQVALVWGFLMLSGLVWLGAYLKFRADWLDQAVYVTTALALHATLKVWLASQATYQLAHDRGSGALELLLSTPLSVREILHGQRLALQRQFALPILLVLVIDALFLLTDASDSDWVALCLAGMGMLVADAVTLHYVGAWAGLTSKHVSRATSSVICRVLVLPWLVFYVGCALYSTAVTFSPGRLVLFNPSFKGLALIWFILGLVNDLAFGLWARHNLLTRFREVAAQRYTGRSETRGFKRLGRALGVLVGNALRSRRELGKAAQ
jgi:ABC-type transport system involved in cytochrome c biogenesis permease component